MNYQARAAALVASLCLLTPVLACPPSNCGPELDRSVIEAKNQLEDLLVEYTTKHPDVQIARRELAYLQAKQFQCNKAKDK